VRDLDMAVEVVGVPLLREADGLAMSSRNVRLTPEHRQQALSISRALLAAKAAVEGAHSGAGESERGEGHAQAAEASAVVERVRHTIEEAGGRVEYVQLSVSAHVTTVTCFASSHHLDYAAHLVSGPARSRSFGDAPVFPLDILEDTLFKIGVLEAAVPHLCAMLLAPKGDPDALDIPIPRAHAEAVSGPWASYWIASYRSTDTYVDAVPPPGMNVVSGMWLYKVKRPLGSRPVFKAR
ncbi:unnamed protein product, partial [Closterium sp. NIES-54]